MATQMEPFTGKVSYAPMMATRTKKDGTEVDHQRFIRIGVRVQLEDGVWWFFSDRAKSWTQHLPGLPLYWRNGSPKLDNKGKQQIGPERKHRVLNDSKLIEEFGHTKRPYDLVQVLFNLREQAEQEEAEKRAASAA